MTLSTPKRRAIRTLAQLIAAGGLTALVSAVADGLTPYASGIVLAGWTVIVSYVVNWLEASGTIPTVLPTSAPPTEDAEDFPLVGR